MEVEHPSESIPANGGSTGRDRMDTPADSLCQLLAFRDRQTVSQAGDDGHENAAVAFDLELYLCVHPFLCSIRSMRLKEERREKESLMMRTCREDIEKNEERKGDEKVQFMKMGNMVSGMAMC